MISDHTHTLIFISGPTASGKSAYALEMAQRHQGEIINADAMQLYRGLPLLTASPTRDEQRPIPHHLYNCCDPQDLSMNASLWARKARAIVQRAFEKGKPCFIVGGSGFYIYAATRGLSPTPEVSLEKRTIFMQQHGTLETAHLYELLKKVDHLTATRLDPHNRQRILRALCVEAHTGHPLSVWHQLPPEPWRYTYRHHVVMPPKIVLHQRIQTRLKRMYEDGVINEVAHFLKNHSNPQKLPVTRALGFDDLAAHIQGASDLTTTLAKISLKTRHYAKRQETWIKKFILKDTAPVTLITTTSNF